MIASLLFGLVIFGPLVSFPSGTHVNSLMLFRVVHIIVGILWIGLLYFFNLVAHPFFGDLDAPTRARVMPSLMLKALWWFRMSALVTVLSGLAYWGQTVGGDARAGGGSVGHAMMSFFVIWTAVWAILFVLICVMKIDNLPLLKVLALAVVAAASYFYLSLNHHGWESNRMLAIGLGGGMGWVLMLNVWGVVWRFQKKLIRWTRDLAENGTAMPPQAAALARQSFLMSRISAILSLPLLFLMAAASHYVMFGQ